MFNRIERSCAFPVIETDIKKKKKIEIIMSFFWINRFFAYFVLLVSIEGRFILRSRGCEMSF